MHQFHLCLYHMYILSKNQPVRSAPIQKYPGVLSVFKSCSTILSCRECLGKPFGYCKHYPRKNGNRRSHRRIDEYEHGVINEYEYDQMYNSQSIVRRSFIAYLTSELLLDLKQNLDGSEAPMRLPHWLRRGITFFLLMD